MLARSKERLDDLERDRARYPRDVTDETQRDVTLDRRSVVLACAEIEGGPFARLGIDRLPNSWLPRYEVCMRAIA